MFALTKRRSVILVYNVKYKDNMRLSLKEVFLLFVLLFFCVKCSYADSNESGAYKTYISKGFMYVKIGKPQKALKAFKAAIKLEPNQAVGYFGLGMAYHELGRYNSAIRSLKKAIEIEPNEPLFYIELGNNYNLINPPKYEDAVKAFKKSIELDPNEGLPHILLGVTYYRMEDTKNSIKELEQGIRIISQSQSIDDDASLTRNKMISESYFILGINYIVDGQNLKAIKTFKKLIKLTPNNPKAYALLGIAYDINGQPQKAESLYKKAISIDPSIKEDLQKMREKLRKLQKKQLN